MHSCKANHGFACALHWGEKLLLCAAFTLSSIITLGQSPPDTVRLLKEVTIEAYAADRPQNEIAASIGMVNQSTLNRFGNTSFVPVFNSISGVRMEERSPGSYRFSIRGSLLRSPFGIRNVKFYWNGLPLTDGGGNTYLNLFDFSSLGKAEVIKGPGGSLYGAGTGGVVLLSSPLVNESQLQIAAQGGSFGSQRYGVNLHVANRSSLTSVQYIHQAAEGYRNQSAMRRDAFNADLSIFADSRSTLRATIFYTDLYYQTPGGLTKTQYDADPSQARPLSGPVPGAEAQQAEVRNKSGYVGLLYERSWNDQWSTFLGAFTSGAEFTNASIRNYESRSERNVGSRFGGQYKFGKDQLKGKVTFGAELQYFNSPILVVNNISGIPGSTILSNDNVTSMLAMGFGQVEIDLPNQIFATLGTSLNYLQYEDQRLTQNPVQTESRKFDPVLSPRIALLKKFSPALSAYASVSKGFSPPSIAEVIPSTGVYNPELAPEIGWSYEAGFKGTIKKIISFNLALYDFHLDNTIVIQRDSTGADYFVNAGNTNQKGVEFEFSWKKEIQSDYISSLNLWASLTYNHFYFGDYVNDGQDYSGNQLTGVAPFISVLGIDLTSRKGLYTNISANYVDRLPLHDANTDFSNEYFLLGARIGYRTSSRKFPFDVFFGVDNLLDQKYSLGNDLNAFGGRYYNAAAPVNYYAGLVAMLSFKRQAQ